MGASVGGMGGDAKGTADSEAALASVRGKEEEKGWERFQHSKKGLGGACDGRKVLVLRPALSLPVWESPGTHDVGTVIMQICRCNSRS